MCENREITATLEEKQFGLKKSRLTRVLYIIGGTLSLALAILGIVLPGLPTTPFALLSAYLYAKSSEKLYNWLLSNRILGPRIRNYNKKKGVTRKGKAGIILFMWTMVSISSFVIIQIQPLRILILSLGLIGAVVVWFFVPTAKNEE
ncbi:MAG TPA: YbaN family protein [Fermentimonas sp.]|nr:YbaN family protein [Fermentimonas sp.]